MDVLWENHQTHRRWSLEKWPGKSEVKHTSHLVMTLPAIAMERSTMLKNGKPSISIWAMASMANCECHNQVGYQPPFFTEDEGFILKWSIDKNLAPNLCALRKGSSKAYKLLERLSEPLAELQCCSLQGKNHEVRLAFWLNCFLAMLEFLVHVHIDVENSPFVNHFVGKL